MAKRKKDHTDWVITKGQLARWQKDRQRQRQIIAIVGVIIAIVLILLIYAIVSETTSDNPTVLTVSGPQTERSFDMDYYVDMLHIYGTFNVDPTEIETKARSVLSNMETNEIYRQLATSMNITATEAEINQRISNVLADIVVPGTGTSTGTPSYEEIVDQLEQNLDQINVPLNRYREVVATEVMVSKVQEQIKEGSVPDEVEQVHIEGILIDTSVPVSAGTPNASGTSSFEIPETVDLDETVAAITSRLSAGESFGTLAMEYSRDFTTNQDGGDLGWYPQGVLNEQIEKVAFQIQPFTLSDPIPASNEEENTSYWLIRIVEKDEARAPEENHREIMENRAFTEWFERQILNFITEIKIDNSGIQDAIGKALS